MKIFISWSGSVSHDVATSLKEWLPTVMQPIDTDDVFLSSEDIGKGEPWFQKLGEVLDECDFGILCLTPQNMREPWILYEAGAVSKRFGHANVVPLRIGFANEELISPLNNLNAAGLDKADMLRLVAAINGKLGSESVARAKLDKAFNAFWSDIAPRLVTAQEEAKSAAAKFEYDVFLSAPMAAYTNDAEYKVGRAGVAKVYDALVKVCGLRVYWAAAGIESMDDWQTVDVSADQDLAALRASRYFVLIYPQALLTSALFEAGYALALKQPSYYFVRERKDLPFLMRELASATQNVDIITQSEWVDYDKLAAFVIKQKKAWFPA